MQKNSLLLLLAGILGTGAFGGLYLQSSSALEAAQASRLKLEEEKASLARHADELKALVKNSKTPLLAPAATVVTNSASVAELNALRAQLAEKEAALAKLQEGREQPERPARPEGEPPKPEEMAERFQKRMDEWKQRDPEGFARMQQSVEERRVEMDKAFSDRLSFIESVDTTGLDPAYVENHQKVVAKLKAAQEAFVQMSAEPFNPANMEKGREMFQSMRELDDALKMEREVMLYDLAGQAGYQGDKAKEFVQYLDQVQKLTTLPRMGRGGPGGFFGGDRGGDRGRGGERPAPAAAQ